MLCAKCLLLSCQGRKETATDSMTLRDTVHSIFPSPLLFEPQIAMKRVVWSRKSFAMRKWLARKRATARQVKDHHSVRCAKSKLCH